jgi:hypothetical protein
MPVIAKNEDWRELFFEVMYAVIWDQVQVQVEVKS